MLFKLSLCPFRGRGSGTGAGIFRLIVHFVTKKPRGPTENTVFAKWFYFVSVDFSTDLSMENSMDKSTER